MRVCVRVPVHVRACVCVRQAGRQTRLGQSWPWAVGSVCTGVCSPCLPVSGLFPWLPSPSRNRILGHGGIPSDAQGLFSIPYSVSREKNSTLRFLFTAFRGMVQKRGVLESELVKVGHKRGAADVPRPALGATACVDHTSASSLGCPWTWPSVTATLPLPLAGSSWKQELLGNQK